MTASRPRLLRRCVAVIVAFATLCSMGASAAIADDAPPVTLGIQPSTSKGPDGRARFIFKASPGDTIKDWVAVTNSSVKQIDVRVVAEDATVDASSGGFTLVGVDKPSKEVGSWTSVDGKPSICQDGAAAQVEKCMAGLGTKMTLKPGQRVNVPFAIKVPRNAEPGDHAGGVAAIFTTATPTDQTQGIETPIEIHVASRVYLRVDGPLNPQVSASGLVIDSPASINPFGGKATVGFDLTNTGNTIISAESTLELSGPLGLGRKKWILPQTSSLVPGGTAHVETELDGVPALGLLSAKLSVSPIPVEGAFGKDTLPASVTLAASTWSIPWGGIALLVVVGLAVAFVIWRRNERKLLDQAIAMQEAETTVPRRHAPAPDSSDPSDPSDSSHR